MTAEIIGKMREALEAARIFIIKNTLVTESRGYILKQIGDAQESEPTTAELVSELRKRDGVESWDVPDDGDCNIYVWDTPRLTADAKTKENRTGKATILRITD